MAGLSGLLELVQGGLRLATHADELLALGSHVPPDCATLLAERVVPSLELTLQRRNLVSGLLLQGRELHSEGLVLLLHARSDLGCLRRELLLATPQRLLAALLSFLHVFSLGLDEGLELRLLLHEISCEPAGLC